MPLIKHLVDDEFDQDRYYDDSSDEELWYGYEEGHYDSDPEEEVPEPEPPDPPWLPAPPSSSCTRFYQVIHEDSDSEDLCYQDDCSGSQTAREIVSSPSPPSISELLSAIQAKLQHLEDKVEKTFASRNVLPTPTSLPESQPHCDPVRATLISEGYVPRQHQELPTWCRDSVPSVDGISKPSLAPPRESKDRGQVICHVPPMSNPLLDHTLGLRLVSSQQINLRESIDLEVVEKPQTTLPEDDAHPPEPSTKPCEWLMEDLPRSNDSGLNTHSETPHFEDLGRSKMCMERVSYVEDQRLI